MGKFGFNIISDYTHHLESIFDKIRDGQRLLDTIIFEITFASVDHIRNLLTDQQLQNPKIISRHAVLSNQLIKLAEENITTDIFTTEPDENIPSSDNNTWYIRCITYFSLKPNNIVKNSF